MPLREFIIPEVRARLSILAKLSQRIELFHDFIELCFALAYNARRSFLEGLLGWNAIEPALLGELFVAGKIEAHQQIHFAIRGLCFLGGFRFAGLGFWLYFRLWLFVFWRLRGFVSGFGSGWRFCFSTFEFVKQFFVETEGLLPAFELMPRKLGFLFVRAEIK